MVTGAMPSSHLLRAPGDSTGWHHHDGPSWVIPSNGAASLSARRAGQLPALAGNAVAEPSNKVHKLDNYGQRKASILRSTVESARLHGPIVPEPEPNCTP